MLAEVFSICDLNKIGKVSFEEFFVALERSGVVTQGERGKLNSMWKDLRVDKNGRVDFAEFSRGLGDWLLDDPQRPATTENTTVSAKSHQEKVAMIFREIDRDKDGLVDMKDVAAMAKLGSSGTARKYTGSINSRELEITWKRAIG